MNLHIPEIARSILHFLVGSFILLLRVSAAQEAVPFVPEITIDGQLEEWDAVPYRVHGVGSALERDCSATVRRAWNGFGLYFAISCLTSEPDGSSGDPVEVSSVDLFVDSRPPTSRMDRYEPGVWHHVIELPDRGWSGSASGISSVSAALSHKVVEASYAVSGALTRIEGLIPARALHGAQLAEGTELSWSIRVNFATAGRAKASIGDTTVERANPIESSPIAFTPVKLVGKAASAVPWDIRCEEVSFNNELWLSVYLCRERDSTIASGPAIISCLPLDWRGSVDWTVSLSGRYELIHEMWPLRLNRPIALADRIAVTVECDGTTIEASATMRAARLAQGVEAGIPTDALESLGARERGMLHLLKACAMEAASLACPNRNAPRAPGKLFRSIRRPDIYDAAVELFIDTAQPLLRGERIDERFPYRAWKSSFDGAWLPVKVVFPIDHDPARAYPCKLVIGGLDNLKSRARFMEEDLIALRNGKYVPFQNDYFTLILYGRGNSHASLGQEELDFVFHRLFPELNIDPERVAVYGGSFGGLVALELAMRHPDRIAWVHSRSGGFNSLTRMAMPTSSRLSNLRGKGLFLEVGLLDVASVAGNRLMAERALALGCDVEHIEYDNTPHSFLPGQPRESIRGKAVPIPSKEWTVVLEEPGSSRVYWLDSAYPENRHRPIKVSGALESGRASIRTENVSQLKANQEIVEGLLRNVIIELDGQVLRREWLTDGSGILDRSQGGWSPAPEFNPSKKPGVSGPIRQIENSPLTVVYGTRDPARTYWLKQRALQVIDTRIGTKQGQWGGGNFELCADADFDYQSLGNRNLWLIGGIQENSVTARLAKDSPIAVTGDEVIVGERMFEGDDLLVGYVRPSIPGGNRLMLVEAGTSPASYSAPVWRHIDHDIVVIRMSGARAIPSWQGDFDAGWSLGSHFELSNRPTHRGPDVTSN